MIKSVTFKILIIFISIFALTIISHANNNEFGLEEFQSGLKSYQSADYDQAIVSFLDSLQKSPNNVSVLYNLGLAEVQKGSFGKAIARWRLALDIDPGFQPAKDALKYYYLKHPQATPPQSSSWENFRSVFLVSFSLNHLILFLSVLTALSGSLLIRFFARRNNAILENTPSPPLPTVGIIFSILWLFNSLILFAKTYDFYSPRGTLVSPKSSVFSSPSQNGVDLFELIEGQEVLLLTSKDDWVQIQIPEGLAGWIPKNDIIQSSGNSPFN